MNPRLIFVGATLAALAATPAAHASIVGPEAFVSPDVIDFNDANPPNTRIGARYLAQGVADTALCGGQRFATSGSPPSEVASNFFEPDCGFGRVFTAKQITFVNPLVRVGFDITTTDSDDTTITAFLGNAFVGGHVFDTFGSGTDGSFVGIEFLGGFDRIEIAPRRLSGGAFAIDNLRFDVRSVPAPATGPLLGLGFAALGVAGLGLRRGRPKAM